MNPNAAKRLQVNQHPVQRAKFCPLISSNKRWNCIKFSSVISATYVTSVAGRLLRDIHLLHQVRIKVGIGDVSVKEDDSSDFFKHIFKARLANLIKRRLFLQSKSWKCSFCSIIDRFFQYFSRIFFIISGGMLSFSYVLNVSRNLMSPSI